MSEISPLNYPLAKDLRYRIIFASNRLSGHAADMNVHPAKLFPKAPAAIRASSLGDVGLKDVCADPADVICRRLSPETPAGSLATTSIHDHPRF